MPNPIGPKITTLFPQGRAGIQDFKIKTRNWMYDEVKPAGELGRYRITLSFEVFNMPNWVNSINVSIKLAGLIVGSSKGTELEFKYMLKKSRIKYKSI